MVSVWRGRRVFLTGHTGFKGGWLALWLSELGAHVRGYALDPYAPPNLFAAARVADVVDDVRGDIRDASRLAGEMTAFAPEIVFHLAAQPLVRNSYADPLATYSINVMGTAHVLEAVRRTPSVRAVVCVTTDKCYDNKEWVWPYRETDSLGGYDPYSSSKACAEIVAAAYRSSFFSAPGSSSVHLATARAGNVIGGGDWSVDRLIPDLVRGFLAGKPVPIRRPHSIRPWQHVLEPLHGYILLAEQLFVGNLSTASAYNFASHEEDAWPVARIAAKMAEAWGDGAEWVVDAEAGVHEATYLKLDANKARTELHWRPQLKMESALEWLVSWYRAWERGESMSQFTISQISDYERLLRDTLGGTTETLPSLRIV